MRVFLKHLSCIPRVRDEDINKAFLRNLGSFNDHLLKTHMTSRNRVSDFHLKTSVSPSSSPLGTDVFAGYLRLRGSNIFMYRSRILKLWSRNGDIRCIKLGIPIDRVPTSKSCVFCLRIKFLFSPFDRFLVPSFCKDCFLEKVLCM